MKVQLAQKHCVPCRGGIPPLTEEERRPLLEELGHGWEVKDGHHLTRSYEFPDFVTALGYVNRLGEIAEEEGHHPDLYLSWGKVRVDVWTHKIDGLTESDFVFAAKAQQAFDERAS